MYEFIKKTLRDCIFTRAAHPAAGVFFDIHRIVALRKTDREIAVLSTVEPVLRDPDKVAP